MAAAHKERLKQEKAEEEERRAAQAAAREVQPPSGQCSGSQHLTEESTSAELSTKVQGTGGTREPEVKGKAPCTATVTPLDEGIGAIDLDDVD